MNYQSPIDVVYTAMQSQIEGEIYKAVMKVGVNVDKDELLKALRYDRDQYKKGYKKGYTDRDSEIVRCKDCRYRHDSINCRMCSEGMETDDDWFCADGEPEKQTTSLYR